VGFRGGDKIKNILSYGYNDTSVIVKCTDILNNVRYLISYETSYKNSRGNPIVSFKHIENIECNQIKGFYKWVEINEGEIDSIKSMKVTFVLGILFFVLLIACRKRHLYDKL